MTQLQTATACSSTMGGPSYEVMVLANAYAAAVPRSSRALDLGCGEGRNAFALSGAGIGVTAVDMEESSINVLRELASRYDRPISTFVSNVTDFTLTETYDVILAHGILHFLTASEIDLLVSRIRRQTRPGGYNCLTISPFASLDEVIDDFKKQGHRNALRQGELLEIYADWEFVTHETYRKWDFHPGQGSHTHPIEKLIFRKPAERKARLLMPTEVELAVDDQEILLAEYVQTRDLIGKARGEVISAFGEPRKSVRTKLEGPQFSFETFCTDGYMLELLFYGHYAIYVSNSVVSGYSLFTSNFFELNPACAPRSIPGSW